MSTFKAYSKYYNLLYKDKLYTAESDYIIALINKVSAHTKTILDMGCGTGKHDVELVNRGYNVHGIDMSNDMLKEAEKSIIPKKLTFSQGDIRIYRDNTKYDAVISLFHVMSYQINNEDFMNALKTAYYHLDKGGIFFFDFWYGPAVLNILPEVKVKELEDEDINITRIAQPIMLENDNVIDVNYKIIIQDKHSMKCEVFTETHKMRYFFRPEIYYYLQQNGFEVKGFYEFLTEKAPSKDTWGACCVAVKK